MHRYKNGRTAVWRAACGGQLTVVTLPVEAGADMHIQDNVSTLISLIYTNKSFALTSQQSLVHKYDVRIYIQYLMFAT